MSVYIYIYVCIYIYCIILPCFLYRYLESVHIGENMILHDCWSIQPARSVWSKETKWPSCGLIDTLYPFEQFSKPCDVPSDWLVHSNSPNEIVIFPKYPQYWLEYNHPPDSSPTRAIEHCSFALIVSASSILRVQSPCGAWLNHRQFRSVPCWSLFSWKTFCMCWWKPQTMCAWNHELQYTRWYGCWPNPFAVNQLVARWIPRFVHSNVQNIWKRQDIQSSLGPRAFWFGRHQHEIQNQGI